MKSVDAAGVTSIRKQRGCGGDGSGRVHVTTASETAAPWTDLVNTPCVRDGFVDLRHEVSVSGARSQGGEVVCFDPGENVQRDGILHTTTVPANLTSAQRTDAVILTGRILNALVYVGVMGVELFVTAKGLIVHDFAPRVHNSGPWTPTGCFIDPFEQHIRAVAGWPLGDGHRHSNVVMTNLIGSEANDVAALSQAPSAGIHLYGKAGAKPGRKMGHVNRITGPA